LVPKDHPIRGIKVIVEQALLELSPAFGAMYSKIGPPRAAEATAQELSADRLLLGAQ
jgi:hypothetical protein